MYIDRRYRGRRKRSPWPAIILLFLVGGVLYLATMRFNWIITPLNPPQPTPTPTRSALSYLAEAEDHYAAGRLLEANEAYIRVAKLEPDSDEAYMWRARLAVMRGHLVDAVELAREAVEMKPSALNLGTLAMTLDWSGQYDEALGIASQAVEKDPMSAEAHAYLAEVYADMNNWIRALDEAETAVEINPNSAIVQRNFGYVLEMQGRYEEAIAAYEKAAEIEPQLGHVYIGAGRNYLAMGDQESALALFQKAAAANPDSPAGYDALGWGSFLADDPDRAIAELRKAIQVDPEFAPAYGHLGAVYYARLNWEAAIENYETAIGLGMRNVEFLYQLGLSYVFLEDCPNAVKWLEEALTIDPDSQAVKEGLRQCSRG